MVSNSISLNKSIAPFINRSLNLPSLTFHSTELSSVCNTVWDTSNVFLWFRTIFMPFLSIVSNDDTRRLTHGYTRTSPISDRSEWPSGEGKWLTPTPTLIGQSHSLPSRQVERCWFGIATSCDRPILACGFICVCIHYINVLQLMYIHIKPLKHTIYMYIQTIDFLCTITNLLRFRQFT